MKRILGLEEQGDAVPAYLAEGWICKLEEKQEGLYWEKNKENLTVW